MEDKRIRQKKVYLQFLKLFEFSPFLAPVPSPSLLLSWLATQGYNSGHLPLLSHAG
jgi:hypothetical protein